MIVFLDSTYEEDEEVSNDILDDEEISNLKSTDSCDSSSEYEEIDDQDTLRRRKAKKHKNDQKCKKIHIKDIK